MHRGRSNTIAGSLENVAVHDEDRRSMLARLVTGVLGLVTAGLAGLFGAVAAPGASSSDRRWRRALSADDLSTGGPTTAFLAERYADGWYQTRRQSVVFIDREGDAYRAFSATCTHLGCRVRWDAEAEQFKCPCHGGVFDREGRVVAGPPPAPLQRLAVRINPQTSDIEVEL
jgi:Rieske Fe-S protein